MRNTLEHPDITSALRTGYPYGTDEEILICPVCAEACERIYFRAGNKKDILGCDECIDFTFWEED